MNYFRLLLGMMLLLSAGAHAQLTVSPSYDVKWKSYKNSIGDTWLALEDTNHWGAATSKNRMLPSQNAGTIVYKLDRLNERFAFGFNNRSNDNHATTQVSTYLENIDYGIVYDKNTLYSKSANGIKAIALGIDTERLLAISYNKEDGKVTFYMNGEPISTTNCYETDTLYVTTVLRSSAALNKLSCDFNYPLEVHFAKMHASVQSPSSGMIMAVAEGGLPPYRFLCPETGSTQASQFGLEAGTYHVIVKDSLNDSLLVSADLGFTNHWRILRDLTITDNGYVKTGTNPNKAGAAIAQHVIAEYTDGFCEVTVTDDTQDLAFGFLGFAKGDKLEGYETPLINEEAIDSLLTYADSLLINGFTVPALPMVAEAYKRLNVAYFKDGIVHVGFKDFSVPDANAMTYQAGDVFKIERTGNAIGLFKNNILLASNSITKNEDQFLLSGILVARGTGFVRGSASLNRRDGISAAELFEPICMGTAMNWVKTRTFDENGMVKSESIAYMDNLGRNIQNQAKQFSKHNSLVSEALFDSWGRAVGQSLPAPSFSSELCYVDHFIERNSSTAYAPTDFDNPVGTGLSGDILDAFNALGDVNHPKAVYNGNQGKLGWYYSNNNSVETFVAADALPYSRVEFYDNGRIRRSAGVGTRLGMGSGHETHFIYTSTPEVTADPASNELNAVFPYNTYQLEKTFEVDPYAAIHNLQLFKTISINPDGRDQISYANAAGQTIATCITGDGSGCVSHLERKVLYPQNIQEILQNIYVPAAKSGTLRLFEEDRQSVNYATATVPALKDLLNNVILQSGTDYTYNNTTGYFTFIGNYANRSLYLQFSYSGTVTANRRLIATAETDYTQWTLYFYDRKGRLLANSSPNEVKCQNLPVVAQRTSQLGAPGLANSNDIVASIDFNSLMKNAKDGVAYISISEIFSPIAAFSSTSAVIYQLKSDSLKYAEDSLYFANDILPKDSLVIDGQDTTQLPAFMFPTDSALAMYRIIDSLETKVPVNALRGKEVHYSGEYAIYGRYSGGSMSAEPLATIPYDFTVTGDGSTDTNGDAIIHGYSNKPRILTSIKIKPEDAQPLDGVVITVKHPEIGLVGFDGDGPGAGGSDGPITWVPQPLHPLLGAIGGGINPFIEMGGILSPKILSIPFANKYMYDEYDRLVGSINEDQGTVYYVYDQKEDKLLFTQNQKQRDKGGKFSCIVYDKQARPVVSGEYDPTNGGPTNGDVPYLFQDYYTWKAGTPVPSGRLSTGVAAVANNDGYNDGHIFERTFIEYDNADASLPLHFGNNPLYYKQNYTAAKVSKTWNDNTTTWYSYDELGRQTWSVQNDYTLGYKTLTYVYDFRGKLLASAYQFGEADNLIHNYSYDADERLSAASYVVLTATTTANATKPLAGYEYYLHGPLKRTELGNKLQGLDYVYTIDGKLKAVNNPVKGSTDKDPGFDGYATGPHASVNPDAFAYALEYYPGDYERSGSPIQSYNNTNAYNNNLSYTGLVKAQSWRTALPAGAPTTYSTGLMYEYQYDEQYRLTGATFGSITEVTLPGTAFRFNTFTQKPEYKLENIDYDKNGNLQHLKRYAAPINSTTAHLLDNLTYNYSSTKKNKLEKVADLATNTAGYSAELDLPNQTNNSNYVYNSIGELIENKQENRGYEYNSAGLVTRVFDLGSNNPIAEYAYNDKGLRYSKTSYSGGFPNIETEQMFYVYDAGGAQVATYKKLVQNPNTTYQLQNHTLYAAGRVGLLDHNTGKALYELSDHLGNVRAVISDHQVPVGSNAVCRTCADMQSAYHGFVSNHGALNSNNLSTFTTYANAYFSASSTSATYLQALTDCKLITNTIDFTGTGYTSSVNNATLNLGTGNASIETWFKCDNTNDYKVLIDNIEWGSVLRGIQVYIYQDKLYACFMEGNVHSSSHVYTNHAIPANQWTHVVITKTGYNPASYAIYINGVAVSVTQAPPASSSGAAGMNTSLPLNLAMGPYAGTPSSIYTGKLRNMKVYNKALSSAEVTANYNGGCITAATVTSNLVFYANLDEGSGTSVSDASGGNLTSTITNAGWTYEGIPVGTCLSPAELATSLCYFGPIIYVAEVIETHDYYPHGGTMPGRNYTSSLSFPYGYQGQEKDQATGLTNFELRQYDPRIGRWYNPDPYMQHHSPYLAMSNNPVSFTDPDGGWDGDKAYKNAMAANDERNKGDFLAQSFASGGNAYNWMATSPADRAIMQKFYGTSYDAQERSRILDLATLGDGYKMKDGGYFSLNNGNVTRTDYTANNFNYLTGRVYNTDGTVSESYSSGSYMSSISKTYGGFNAAEVYGMAGNSKNSNIAVGLSLSEAFRYSKPINIPKVDVTAHPYVKVAVISYSTGFYLGMNIEETTDGIGKLLVFLGVNADYLYGNYDSFSKGGKQGLWDDELSPLSNEALSAAKKIAKAIKDTQTIGRINKEEKRRGERNKQKRGKNK
jgi:RHS repeat-associated protein